MNGELPTTSTPPDIRNGIQWRAIMTIKTAAKFAGMSKRHFSRVIEEYEVPLHVMGHRSLVILGRDLLEFMSTRAAEEVDRNGRHKWAARKPRHQFRPSKFGPRLPVAD